MHSQILTVLVTIGGLIPVGGVALWVLKRMHGELVKAVAEGVAAELKPLQHAAPTIEEVHRQVTPTNGTTTARLIEQSKEAIDRVEAYHGSVEEYHASVASMAVLLAQHISDNHGPEKFPV